MEPVFKSYVFVHISEDKKWDLKKINGVLNFVYWLGKPARIRDEDICTIKKFLEEFSNVKVEEQYLTIKTKVRIRQGVFMNYKGVIMEIFGNHAKVQIESMGIQLSAQFDKKNLELLSVIEQR